MGSANLEQQCTRSLDSDDAICQFRSLGAFHDKSGAVGPQEVFQCVLCGHGMSSPQIEDVSFLYKDRTSQDYQPDARGLAHAIKEIVFRHDAKKLLRQIGPTPGDILDFGCGSGQFTRLLGELNRGNQTIGSDMHESAPHGLPSSHYLQYSQLDASDGMFDCVIAMHVLEHDSDPEALLIRIARLVRGGGLIVLEVPNIDCVWNKVFGKYWDSWYLPYHRHHFSQVSLSTLVRSCGLSSEAVIPITAPAMGRSFANVFGQKNNLFWLLLGAVVHPLQVVGELLAGRKTAIRIFVRKPE